MNSLFRACAAAALVAAASIALSAQAPVLSERQRVEGPVESQVDRVFAKWTTATPGCAVGVAKDGRPVLAKGYGMADLEHDVRNEPDTIFEAGSVSKQFTAAAVLLLAREGKLSIDDPVRKYIPELPEYPQPLLIRHMLNHTSGLRDWGSVAAIAGWPRTTRVYTHAHVLDIVSRQKALNFAPGTNWSYSNTGFNLAAIIVARVSGVPFAAFTRDRLFAPLGMTHTSWRDDYTRIVKHRAIAYEERAGSFAMDMPFEDVHGNGGLLTTVGDLLKWNENFTTPVVGDASFVALQQTPGTFNDGRPHEYAFGLYARTYKGVRIVEHSGSTAGYRAHLLRHPDQRVSVAVLCNAGSGLATQYAHDVADLYLGDSLKPPPPAPPRQLSPAELDAAAGLFRHLGTGVPLTIARENDRLRAGRTVLIPRSATSFVTANGSSWDVTPAGARETDAFGTVDAYERVAPAKPTATQLSELAGTYASDEAEVEIRAAVENGQLVLKRRPDTIVRLTPSYQDAFGAGSLGTVIFRRDAGGRISGFSVSQERVWDIRFAKKP